MKKLCIFAFLLTLTSCGTFRPWQDPEIEKLTEGVRTMASNNGWTGSGCLENAITKAKEDCQSENKKYEYVSHHIFFNAQVLYRCK